MHACVMQKERPQTGKEKCMESLIARVYHKHIKILRSIYKSTIVLECALVRESINKQFG